MWSDPHKDGRPTEFTAAEWWQVKQRLFCGGPDDPRRRASIAMNNIVEHYGDGRVVTLFGGRLFVEFATARLVPYAQGSLHDKIGAIQDRELRSWLHELRVQGNRVVHSIDYIPPKDKLRVVHLVYKVARCLS
jgi:hypothetical protein